MNNNNPNNCRTDRTPILLTKTYRRFVLAILDAAQRSVARGDYVKSATVEVLKKACADRVELRLRSRGHFSQCVVQSDKCKPVLTRNIQCSSVQDGSMLTVTNDDPPLYGEIARSQYDPSLEGFTKKGSAWAATHFSDDSPVKNHGFLLGLFQKPGENSYGSSVLLPLIHQGTHAGLLHIRWYNPDVVSQGVVEAL